MSDSLREPYLSESREPEVVFLQAISDYLTDYMDTHPYEADVLNGEMIRIELLIEGTLGMPDKGLSLSTKVGRFTYGEGTAENLGTLRNTIRVSLGRRGEQKSEGRKLLVKPKPKPEPEPDDTDDASTPDPSTDVDHDNDVPY